MTEKDLEIQSLRRALKLTEEMYDKQLEVNEQLHSINELLASENAALKTEIEKIGRMPKNKGIYQLFRTKGEFEHYTEEIRRLTRIFTLDHVTIALGRMGFRESKFREFDRILTEVFQEYMADYHADLKDDRYMEYSRACLDRELKQYTGKLFVPEEERYK